MTSVLSKFTSIQNLENNNQIILDTLTNICQKYANLNVMTNQFLTTFE